MIARVAVLLAAWLVAFAAWALPPNASPTFGRGKSNLPLSLTFQTSATGAGSYPGLAFGTPAADRVVVVLVSAGFSSGATIGSMTVGGVAAGRRAQAGVTPGGGLNYFAEVWSALVPTGTTGDVVLGVTGPLTSATVGVYEMHGATTQNPTNVGTNSGSASSLGASLAVPTGGVGVGVFVSFVNSGSPSATWTNLTENYDGSPSQILRTGASIVTAGTATRTATSTQLGFSALALAAWGP